MDLFGATVSPIVVFFLVGELTVLAVLVASYLMARMHMGVVHHYTMLAAFAADLLIFKPLMYSRSISVWGGFPWDGTRIAPHLLLSIAAAVFGLLAVALGFKHRIKKGSKMFLPPKGRLHKVIGLAFLVLWGGTFVLGLLVFMEAYIG